MKHGRKAVFAAPFVLEVEILRRVVSVAACVIELKEMGRRKRSFFLMKLTNARAFAKLHRARICFSVKHQLEFMMWKTRLSMGI